MKINRAALINQFRIESAEHIAEMEKAVLDLERSPENSEVLNSLFRSVHTLKGNAYTLDLNILGKFAHQLEDVLDHFRKKTAPIRSELCSILLKIVDALRSGTAAAADDNEHLWNPDQDLLRRLRLAAGLPSSEIEAISATVQQSAESTQSIEKIQGTHTLRIGIEKLDLMLDLTGEITIAQGRLQRLLLDLGDPGKQAAEMQEQVSRLLLELQEQVMKVRMVPLQPLFEQYYRPVRDISRQQGKLTRLVVNAADVEADTTVIEHLRDPLMHLIRNAMDHGIEKPETRRRRGKQAMGVIQLSARHDTGSLVVEISDDGNGLNSGRILERARAMGLIQEGQQLSEQETFNLIFEPGFSTAANVSELSGRGVGLDVVRRNVESLRGSVTVRSKAGEGCTLILRMPLSLALISGFAVGVGEESYVIPLDHVVECIDLKGYETSTERDGAGLVNLRGVPVPYMSLGRHFGIPCDEEPERGIVIVESDGKRAGLLVNALHGDTQIVVKPLGHMFQEISGISGSAIMGSGRVALLLDVPTLMSEFDSVIRESEAIAQ